MAHYRYIILLLIATGFVISTSCTNKYAEEVRDIQNEIDDLNKELDNLVSSMNSDIESISILVRSLEQKDYITGVEPTYDNGEIVSCRISFFKGDDIVIHCGLNGKDGNNGEDGLNGKDGNSGKDGYCPSISVRQDADGKWYWTVNDEWLLDATGKKICLNPMDGMDGSNGTDGINGSSGVTPIMKIDNNVWYISTDGGATWVMYLTASGSQGSPGSDGVTAKSIFDRILILDNSMVFYLSNGAIITIPLYVSLSLNISQTEDILITAGGSVELSYEILGAVDDVLIECVVEGDWKAEINKNGNYLGKVIITAPDPYYDGNVIVIVNAPDGRLVIKSLSFKELK